MEETYESSELSPISARSLLARAEALGFELVPHFDGKNTTGTRPGWEAALRTASRPGLQQLSTQLHEAEVRADARRQRELADAERRPDPNGPETPFEAEARSIQEHLEKRAAYLRTPEGQRDTTNDLLKQILDVLRTR